MKKSRVILVFGAVLAVCGMAQAQQWGDLTGKFVFDGKAPTPAKVNVTKDNEVFDKENLVDESLKVSADGGLANVVVYLRTANAPVNMELANGVPPKVVYDNKGGKFVPHILPVWLEKQTVVLHNSDPVGHNSNVQPLGDAAINPLLPANSSVDHKFNRQQNIPVPVGCNIHPWMKGFILPRNNPYATVSKEDGTFKIEKLPVGEYEFQVWQERMGYVDIPGSKPAMPKGRFKFTIKPGTNDLGVIKVPASLVK